MSEEQKNPNEEQLWDLISTPPTGDKAEKPARQSKSEPRFAKPRAEKAPAASAKRKIDGFFLACMTGVAAISVVLTLLISSALGSGVQNGPTVPSVQKPSVGETVPQGATDLERENAQLRAQLEQQKKQIQDLQEDLLQLMGSEEYLATAPSTPEDGGNEHLDAQVEAYEIFAQIQQAYADFDRAKLEELIPEMDARLNYLSSDALNSYYQILEYVEQPSNG